MANDEERGPKPTGIKQPVPKNPSVPGVQPKNTPTGRDAAPHGERR